MPKQVAVLELRGGVPNGFKCFIDDGVGNRQAEKYFAELIIKCETNLLFSLSSENDISDAISDGHYERGDYGIYIIHEYSLDDE